MLHDKHDIHSKHCPECLLKCPPHPDFNECYTEHIQACTLRKTIELKRAPTKNVGDTTQESRYHDTIRQKR